MRSTPPALVAVFALTVVALAPACSSPGRNSAMPGRAVVVWEPQRAADAESAKTAMEAQGWTATTVAAGPVHRTRSSLAIYAQRHHVGHGAELEPVLEPIVGEIDVLPFLTDGPGGNDAVLWLADR
jgi:hypothetical protein